MPASSSVDLDKKSLKFVWKGKTFPNNQYYIEEEEQSWRSDTTQLHSL